jgi:hypothetical protein
MRSVSRPRLTHDIGTVERLDATVGPLNRGLTLCKSSERPEMMPDPLAAHERPKTDGQQQNDAD